jgi:hypothetical protein
MGNADAGEEGRLWARMKGVRRGKQRLCRSMAVIRLAVAAPGLGRVEVARGTTPKLQQVVQQQQEGGWQAPAAAVAMKKMEQLLLARHRYKAPGYRQPS